MGPGPPAELAGNTFTTCAPARWAARTSVGVVAPDISTAPARLQGATRSGSTQGETRKRAPARRQVSAVSTSGTVPAPTSSAGSEDSSRMRPGASGIVMVISKMRRPAS